MYAAKLIPAWKKDEDSHTQDQDKGESLSLERGRSPNRSLSPLPQPGPFPCLGSTLKLGRQTSRMFPDDMPELIVALQAALLGNGPDLGALAQEMDGFFHAQPFEVLADGDTRGGFEEPR